MPDEPFNQSGIWGIAPAREYALRPASDLLAPGFTVIAVAGTPGKFVLRFPNGESADFPMDLSAGDVVMVDSSQPGFVSVNGVKYKLPNGPWVLSQETPLSARWDDLKLES